MIVKQAMKAALSEFSKQESKKQLADEANLFEIHLVNPDNKPKAVPVPKHKFLWEQPLNTGNIMEDDGSACWPYRYTVDVQTILEKQTVWSFYWRF